MYYKWLPEVIISLLKLNKSCCVPPEKLRSHKVEPSLDLVAWTSPRPAVKEYLGMLLGAWVMPLFQNRNKVAAFIHLPFEVHSVNNTWWKQYICIRKSFYHVLYFWTVRNNTIFYLLFKWVDSCFRDLQQYPSGHACAHQVQLLKVLS